MNTAGFYNNKGEYAARAVYGPTYVLLAQNKDFYTYPVNGWTWYNSAEEAMQAEGFDQSVVDAINQPFLSNINNSEE